MLHNIKQRLERLPKSVALIIAFAGGIALASALFLIFRSSSKADDNLMPRAARIERVDGSVGLAHAQSLAEQSQLDWEEAQKNATLVTGDRVYARDGSRATVAFTGRNYARLDSGSALDVLSLTDRRTQLALRNGSAIFDVGELADDELFEVATPNGAFGFDEPGLYQLGIGDDGNTWISVLSGLAQVVGLAGTGQVSRGEMLTLVGQAASQILLSKLAPDYAAGIVDDYYDYRYPDVYDGRYSSYDAYLDDPYYYNSNIRSVSYDYVPYDIPGAYDLDTYGDWTDIDGYGRCWSPRVDTNWVPYRNGYWDTGSIYGPTWISQEPWGWVPYHYGRWAYVNNRQWVWVPERVEQPVYAPALVAFVPITQSRQIGWVPLAPGEAYLPRCYDANFQPQYFASPGEVEQVISVRNYTNFNYPQAVTVVPVQNFTHVVETERRVRFDPQFIAQAQPVLDPYAVEGMRNVADDSERRRFKMARAFNKEVLNTPVVTSVQPMVLPGRENLSEALPIATVSKEQRKNRLKVQESGQVITAKPQNELARTVVPQADAPAAALDRHQQIQELARRSREGDRAARRELKRMAGVDGMRQPGAVNPAIGQIQPKGRELKQLDNPAAGETTQNPRKLQKQLDRQQMSVSQQQRVQMQQTQELTRRQRKAQRREEEQRNLMKQQQLPAVQPKTPIEQLRSAQQAPANAQLESRAQKQAMREPRQLPQQGQPQADQQRLLKQQMKQQRRLQEQQMQPQMQQRQMQQQGDQQRQLKQQMKQQRQMQEQQVQQQRQMQVQQIQRQQMKQQRQMQEQQIQRQPMQEQQMRQQQTQPQQGQIDKQQRQAERRAMQQQQSPQQQVVQPQQAPQQQGRKPVEDPGPPTRSNPDAANQQPKAEKARRKAGKGNQ